MKFVPLALILALGVVNAQDPSRFEAEVAALNAKYDSLWDPSKETVVFTGSSSIRFWRNLQELFPAHQVVNTGFGGSQTSDLLAYDEALIFRYQPRKVFVYEGDNDLNDAKKPRSILKDTRELVSRIKSRDPQTEVVLIAAKPSLVRWHLKRKYKRLNRLFKRFSRKEAGLEYADVWTVMLRGNKVRDDLFIEDGLHMNSKGYRLWYDIIKNYIN